MRPKATIAVAMISLSLAGGLFWGDPAAGQNSRTTSSASKKNAETPLSYQGRLAISVAEELAMQKKYTEALKQADNAIRTDPKSGTPHIIRAYILDMLGDSRKASASFKKAIKLSPHNGYVRYSYASHLCGLQDFPAADENYLLATKDASYPIAHKAYEGAAECALKAEKLDAAEAHARAALAIAPENIGALATMARIMHKQSKYFEARAFIQRREAAGPLNVPLLQLAQQIEKSAGDDRAAAKYQKQLELMSQAQIQPPKGEGQKKP